MFVEYKNPSLAFQIGYLGGYGLDLYQNISKNRILKYEQFSYEY